MEAIFVVLVFVIGIILFVMFVLFDSKTLLIKVEKIPLFDVVTVAVSLISLLVLVYSLLQVSRSLRSTSFQNITTQLQDLNGIFLQDGKATYWKYFHDKARIDGIGKENKDYGLVRSIADSHLDSYDSFYFQAQFPPEIANGTEAREAWDVFIGDSFANSHALCVRLQEVHSWYINEFRSVAVAPCKACWNIDIPSNEHRKSSGTKIQYRDCASIYE